MCTERNVGENIISMSTLVKLGQTDKLKPQVKTVKLINGTELQFIGSAELQDVRQGKLFRFLSR